MNQLPDSSTARLFVVTVQFSVAPARHAEFMREMVHNARQSRRHEPGCLAFDVCQDPARADHVFLYEVYQDEEAFEQHKRETHFLDFDRKVASWVIEKKVKILNLIDR